MRSLLSLPCIISGIHSVRVVRFSEYAISGGKGVMAAQRLVAGAQILGVIIAPNKAQVWGLVDEVLRRSERSFCDQVGPELLGFLELAVDTDSPLAIYRAVRIRKIIT